ncbi:MAG TPA: sulfatase-like hydrolase/transferase [Polyangia bacterium]|nr:sulfatase-like hydrolase/transferase [Polyangia bacterium]
MSAAKTWPVGTGALLGAAAGVLVGIGDGARAAFAFGVEGRSAIAAVALSVAVDALAGLLGGAALEALARVARWGRAVPAPQRARFVGFFLAAVATAEVTSAVVIATATRNNRFLAAGLAALAAVGVGALGALLAPAIGRALSRPRQGDAEPEAVSASAILLFAPIIAAVGGGAVFLLLSKTRAPLAGQDLAREASRVGLVGAFLPWTLATAVRARLEVSWKQAAAAGALVYGAVAARFVSRNWTDDLRFAPWLDLGVGAAILVVALVLLATFVRWGGRLPKRRGATALTALFAFVGLVAMLLGVSASEAARKAGVARAGLVAPVLEVGRALLDFDHDGYAGWLGGGDCDDHDPGIHPEALDFPNDGVDSDCDGQDAAAGLPPPATMVDLPASVPRDLNLLFVTIDTLRADHLGCYGYARPTSPEIDRLAARGTLFENGWAHAPSTRYSMPALASGRWPSAIEWDESIWWPRLSFGTRTLGEAMHDAGYFTGGLFSYTYFQASDKRGFERGMDVFSTDRAALHVAVNGPMESRGSSSREMTDDAIAFLDAHKDRKFFLWVHYYDPHLSYEPHPEVPSFGAERVDLYDGEIRYTDLHLGRLLAHLEQLGLWDRTAIVLTGDHGEGFGEHGITEHGFDLYAPQTRVPFIVRVPGLPPHKSAVPVGHIDVAPTLVNLARAHAEPSFIGRSLVPELAGATPPDEKTRWVFQEVTSERGKKRALVTTTRHLIWNWVPNDTTECYDRVADPAEAHDLWGRAGADKGGACLDLKGDLQRLVAALALPPGAAEKMARGVTPPGAPAPPPPAHVVDAKIGDPIEVRGYDVAPEAAAPGSDVVITTHFAVKQRLAAGWKLFFHLEGPGGFRNLDHVPVDGLMPLERWRPGQLIHDVQHIFMPAGSPRGTYTVYIGAFRGNEHLTPSPKALVDPAGRLKLATFLVK